MARDLDAQTCGSVLVVLAFVASELSAAALSAHPGSGLAWYLHLEVFGPFEAARGVGSPVRGFFGPHAAAAGCLVLVALLALRRLRFRLAVALAAHLAFLFAGSVAYAWLTGGAGVATASIAPVALPQRPDGWLLSAILAASFAASAIGHSSLLRAALGPDGRERVMASCHPATAGRTP